MLVIDLLTVWPCCLQLADRDQYHSQLPWKVVHQVYWNAISYQYVISLIVSLLIRGRPGVFMNVSTREHRAPNN
jgi:hypothetical protein